MTGQRVHACAFLFYPPCCSSHPADLLFPGGPSPWPPSSPTCHILCPFTIFHPLSPVPRWAQTFVLPWWLFLGGAGCTCTCVLWVMGRGWRSLTWPKTTPWLATKLAWPLLIVPSLAFPSPCLFALVFSLHLSPLPSFPPPPHLSIPCSSFPTPPVPLPAPLPPIPLLFLFLHRGVTCPCALAPSWHRPFFSSARLLALLMLPLCPEIPPVGAHSLVPACICSCHLGTGKGVPVTCGWDKRDWMAGPGVVSWVGATMLV